MNTTTEIKTPDLTLTGSLLVAQYNEMVATAIDLGMRAVEVNRFATNAAGVTRTERLHANIQVRAQALRDAAAEAAELEAATGRGANTEVAPLEVEMPETSPAERDGLIKSHMENPEYHTGSNLIIDTPDAGHPTTEGNPAPAEEDEEAIERLPEESEEDYMARKAAKKTARGKTRTKATDKPKSTSTAGPRRSTTGTTIREKTEEFNRLVPQAKKAGIDWVKHHTSNFESQEKADKQLARLRDAMKKAVK